MTAHETWLVWFQPHLPPVAALFACAGWAALAQRTGFTLRNACALSIPIVAATYACMPYAWLIPFSEPTSEVLLTTLSDAASAACRMFAAGTIGALLGSWISARGGGNRRVHSAATPRMREVLLLIAGFCLLALFVERAPQHVEYMRLALWAHADGVQHEGAWYPGMYYLPEDLLAHVLGFEISSDQPRIDTAQRPALLIAIRWMLAGLVPLTLAVRVLNAAGRSASQRLRWSAVAAVGLLLVVTVSWLVRSTAAFGTLDPTTVQRALTNQGSLLIAMASLVAGLFGFLLLTEASWCAFRATVWLIAMAASGTCLRYLLNVFVQRATFFEHIRAEALSQLLVEFGLLSFGVGAVAAVAIIGRSRHRASA